MPDCKPKTPAAAADSASYSLARHPPRRVVRRRSLPTLDQVYETALSELDIEGKHSGLAL
jgi:hypothetical protein